MDCRDAALFAINQTAAVLLEQYGDLEAASAWMQHMIALGPEKGMAYSNLAYLLGRQGKKIEALMMSQKAVDSGVQLPEIYYNHGVILGDLGRLEEAVEAYRKSIELRPDYAIVHFNLGSCLIQLGQHREGLKEFEWRMRSHPNLIQFRERYMKPDWNGEDDLQGKTILVVNEQGTGDAVQFCRYLPDLKAKGCKIIVEVQDELVSFFQQLDVDGAYGRDTVDLLDKRPLPPYDFVTCFSSFPYFFDADLARIPCSKGYLAPLKSKKKIPAAFWAKYPCKLRVGICWAGSIWHPLDHIRSCHLREFAPLLTVPGVKLFSLQKGPMIRQWEGGDLMAGSDGMEIVDCHQYMEDFNETANLIKQLDLVITVDTTIAHLAAAIGHPVWMMTAYTHDWRWDDFKNTTRWYESMRIYQQVASESWGKEVIPRIVKELKEYGGHKPAPRINRKKAQQAV
jgi:tetratricopeptide (TPR) repeat protein